MNELITPAFETPPVAQTNAPGPMPITDPTLYVGHRELVGVLAQWAIHLNPIFPPRNLDVAIQKFYDATIDHFTANKIYYTHGTVHATFLHRMDLREYLQPIIESIPEIVDWNRSAHEVDADQPVAESAALFISGQFNDAIDPRHDFVDLTALVQNISNYFHFEACRNRDFDIQFRLEHPSPPPITEALAIPMRDDGELPAEQREETFEEWLERVTQTVKGYNDLIKESYTKIVSRIDGGLMGTVPGDVHWLYDMGIREAIQMMDSEPDKKACIGFSPSEQKWFGWARSIQGFGIGHVVQEGDIVTESGRDADTIAQHPEKDYRVPVGYEAKTLQDCKRLAIAFAESLS